MNLVLKPFTYTSDGGDCESDYYNDNAPIINSECLYFGEPVQNSLMNDSYFIRIIYSDHDVSLVGLMIPIYLNSITVLKTFNKSIIMYDLHSHRDIVSKISDLELSILERYNQFLNMYKKYKKCPVYNLTTQLKSCSVKLFDDIDKKLDECNLVLKISGIWESDKEIGITFKFILLC